jgi:hypothetical protein
MTDNEAPFKVGDTVRLRNPDAYFERFSTIKNPEVKNLLINGITISEIIKNAEGNWLFKTKGRTGSWTCAYYELVGPSIEDLFRSLDEKIERMLDE